MRGRQIFWSRGPHHHPFKERQFQSNRSELLSLWTNRDDFDSAQTQVEGVCQARMEIHALSCSRQQAIEQNIGLLAPSFVAGQDGQADKVLRSDSIWIGRCFVNR